MRTVRSILVPTDFSEAAMDAYQYALRLADQLDARIDLLHVIFPTDMYPTGYGGYQSPFPERIQREAEAELKSFFQRGVFETIDDLAYAPSVGTHLGVGSLRSGIHAHLRERDSQLIVLGTRRREGRWERLFGSNASHLTREPLRPTLVVPEGFPYREIQDVCFATDLNDIGAFQAGKLLRALRPLQPKLHFLHVRTDADKPTGYDLKLLREVFDRPEKKLSATFAQREGMVVSTIFDYATEQQCDLVVMHRPDRPWFSELLRRSQTQEAVLKIGLPLLILSAGDLSAVDPTSP